MREPLLTYSFSPRGAVPVPLPLLFFFFSSFFHPIHLRGYLSCPFGCLRSSASVQPMLHESFPFVDVFLMHLWGEMNSTSSHSSTILIPPTFVFTSGIFPFLYILLIIAFSFPIRENHVTFLLELI